MSSVRPILFIAALLLTILPFTEADGQRVESRHVHTYTGSRFLLHDTSRRGVPDSPGIGRAMPVYRRVESMAVGKTVLKTGKTTAVTGGMGIVTAGPLQIAVNTSPSTCNAENGSVAVKATGGTPPYLYSFGGQPFGTIAYMEDFGPDNVQVTVMDATGATATTTANIGNNFPQVECAVTVLQYPSGCTGTNGSVQLTPIGGVAPYSYSIDYVNYQASNVFTGLPPGDYNFFIKDANGCIGTTWYPIAGGACYTGMGGSGSGGICTGTGYIDFSVVNRPLPITYSLDGVNFQSNERFNNLPTGSYNLYIKDGTGQLYLYRLYIYPMCFMIPSLTVTDASCGNSDGTITASAANGSAPYLYSIDGFTYQAGNTFSGLAPGYYTIFFKDATGWVRALNPYVNNGCPLAVTAVARNSTCGYNNGGITATASGGEAPFTYSIDGVHFQASSTFSPLPDGNYTVTVKDANGSTGTAGATVTDVPGPGSMTVTAQTADCNNIGGALTVGVTGGTSPYQYSLDNINYQPGNVFSGLYPGQYYVYIKDANGCLLFQYPWTVPRLNCLALSASVTDATCGNSNGTITAAGSNGSGPYQYSLDGINFQTSGNFTVGAGSYTVTVKDALGYTRTAGAAVGNVPGPQLSAAPSAASCLNSDGGFVLFATGGTQPFQFAADGQVFQNGTGFSGLTSGMHTAMVKDANGCTAAQTVIVPLTNTLSVNAGSDPTICQGTGAVLDAVSNGKTFSWLPAAGLSDASLLQPTASPSITTTYTLTAKLGVCQGAATVTVDVNPAPVADAGKDTAICYGQSLQLKGGGGSFYQWSPVTDLDNSGIADPTVEKPRNSRTYQLMVTDALGCRSLRPAKVTVTVIPPPVIFIGNDTSVIGGQPVPLNVEDINNSGFSSYTWTPAEGLSDPSIRNPVASVYQSATYTVVASTSSGCEASASISLKVYSAAGIFVPNAFTPNGDGHNDVLKALPVGIARFQYFAVYARWGQRVFFTTDAGQGWDGMAGGQRQSPGTYVWMAGGIDYRGQLIERKGTVILIR